MTEKKLPFPQANDLDKVLILIVEFNYRTKNELMKILNLSSVRQMSYYYNACIFLGFMVKKNRRYELSNLGNIISSENKKYRELRLILQLLKSQMILESYLLFREKTNDEKLLEILKKYNSFESLSESTKLRRLSTIRRWVEWIIKKI